MTRARRFIEAVIAGTIGGWIGAGLCALAWLALGWSPQLWVFVFAPVNGIYLAFHNDRMRLRDRPTARLLR